MISDDSAFSAIMHNMSSIKVAHMRQLAIRGKGPALNFAAMLPLVDSVGNYDQLVGVLSFDAYLPILRAQLLSFEGRSIEALTLFDEHLAQVVGGQGQGRLECYLLAERAWCHCCIGNAIAAKSDADLAESCIRESTHVDDRAATLSRLASIYLKLNDSERARDCLARANHYWDEYEKIQTSYIDLLSTAEIPIVTVSRSNEVGR